ncbi:MAG TPA: hypothetical protein ENF51_00100, partial [Candidatus Aenigmarchaeota archaeon]|nr:hypothetical protein [Candidatus Aenigmarchaeota archaeon]
MYKVRNIVRESLPVLITTSGISMIAGLFLQNMEKTLYTVPFLLTIIPALNDMIGDFCCILTSRLSTAFKLGYLKLIRKVFLQIFFVSFLSSLYLAEIGCLLHPDLPLEKAILIVLLTSSSLILTLSAVTYVLMLYTLRKNVDPDNVIIPIATSLA